MRAGDAKGRCGEFAHGEKAGAQVNGAVDGVNVVMMFRIHAFFVSRVSWLLEFLREELGDRISGYVTENLGRDF